MLLAEPDIFDKVFALDPVSPTGLLVPENHSLAFPAIKESRNYAFKFLSFAAPTLFTKESLTPGVKAQFRQETSDEQKELFNLIVDKARTLSDGAGTGTLYHLRNERINGMLAKETYRIKQPTLVLWGEEDTVIPHQDTDETVKLLPNCKLQIIKHAGHSLILENPDLYTQIFVDFFRNN
jgi:pimeloyl-ACP methyl ester carboxylesterase